MYIKEVEFKISSPDLKSCPKHKLPEYAFIGRSNVGKSSLINMLTRRKKLAKTSSTPGKTRLINFFLADNNWYIVDLPGYGYAKASKRDKRIFSSIIQSYVEKRDNLECLFVLLDIRLPLQKIDAEFINWIGKIQVPFAIIFTKADKLSKNQADKNINKITKELLKTWEILPNLFISSATNNIGRKEILEFIDQINISVRDSEKLD